MTAALRAAALRDARRAAALRGTRRTAALYVTRRTALYTAGDKYEHYVPQWKLKTISYRIVLVKHILSDLNVLSKFIFVLRITTY